VFAKRGAGGADHRAESLARSRVARPGLVTIGADGPTAYGRKAGS
jgi:hypothetical protein